MSSSLERLLSWRYLPFSQTPSYPNWSRWGQRLQQGQSTLAMGVWASCCGHFIWHISWHSIWHFIWHSIWHILYADILLAFYLTFYLAFYLAYIIRWHSSSILSDILYLPFYLTFYLAFYLAYIIRWHSSGILSDILYLPFYLTFYLAFYLAYIIRWHYSDILSDILYLPFYLTFYLAFYLAYIIRWHSSGINSIWHFIWHSIWHIFYADILLAFYLTYYICHSIWHFIWHSIWHILYADILLAFYLAFYMARYLTLFWHFISQIILSILSFILSGILSEILSVQFIWRSVRVLQGPESWRACHRVRYCRARELASSRESGCVEEAGKQAGNDVSEEGVSGSVRCPAFQCPGRPEVSRIFFEHVESSRAPECPWQGKKNWAIQCNPHVIHRNPNGPNVWLRGSGSGVALAQLGGALARGPLASAGRAGRGEVAAAPCGSVGDGRGKSGRGFAWTMWLTQKNIRPLKTIDGWDSNHPQMDPHDVNPGLINHGLFN